MSRGNHLSVPVPQAFGEGRFVWPPVRDAARQCSGPSISSPSTPRIAFSGLKTLQKNRTHRLLPNSNTSSLQTFKLDKLATSDGS
jgi:hypothetical protein